MDREPFSGIRPMLAFSVGVPFDSADHIFEAKWEGYRCLAFVGPEGVCLKDRCNEDITLKYPELKDAGQLLEVEEVIVDGEIIVLEEGRPNIAQLQYRQSLVDSDEIRIASQTTPVLYIIFDILNVNGKPVMDLPQLERKEILKSSFRPSRNIVIGSFVPDNGKAFYDQMIKAGFEGMVAKEKGGTYVPGVRNESWLKVGQFRTQDCLICGYTVGMGRRAEMMGALVLGVYCNERLMHVGQVGSGFTKETMRNIFDMLQLLRTQSCPFPTEPIIERPVTWVKPELICRIEYADWTSDKKLRLPRFVKLRSDKPKEECTIEDLAEYKSGACD